MALHKTKGKNTPSECTIQSSNRLENTEMKAQILQHIGKRLLDSRSEVLRYGRVLRSRSGKSTHSQPFENDLLLSLRYFQPGSRPNPHWVMVLLSARNFLSDAAAVAVVPLYDTRSPPMAGSFSRLSDPDVIVYRSNFFHWCGRSN